MLVETVTKAAHDCGFELAGIAAAGPVADFTRYERWTAAGHAGEMRYLTDHRAQIRADVRNLLPSARSVICVGKLYNTAPPSGPTHVSRYAWGRDYHTVMKAALQRMVNQLLQQEPFEYKLCVDTAPLLERSLARQAGLGWIGKNTCLINQPLGSWFFLGEVLTSLELAPGAPPPDRCGSCTRCIDACPTQALVPDGDGWTLDSRRCISYLTIELRGPIPKNTHAGIGQHLFGCDICQEVCPWNRRAPFTSDSVFAARPLDVEEIPAMTPAGFQQRFADSPIARARLAGLQRNAEIVLKNRAGASAPLAPPPPPDALR